MENSKAYDLPVRIFHWTFALLFMISFSIAKLIDDDSSLYAYHMLSGLLMVSVVLLRIVWGFVGSKTSQFKSFQLKPSELRNYIKSMASSKSKRYLGHNPASSYATIVMMMFAIGIGITGVLMSLEISKHFFEDVHELMANGFFIIVFVHISGVILHQFRHSDGLIYSMINGKKAKTEEETEIKSNHPFVAIFFVLFLITMASFLLKSYDKNTGKLFVFGTTLQLSESDKSEHKEKKGSYLRNKHDDDEDYQEDDYDD